ncbi:MAG: hypothetical protein QM811_07745 [Pirellulales bacterium]
MLMMTSRRVLRSISVWGVLIACLAAGCGGSRNGFQPVTGMVTFQGETVADGTIQFYQAGPPPVMYGGAMIRNGKYELPATHGLPAGDYVVRISSPERANPAETDGGTMSAVAFRERIPARYNEKSELKITVQPGESTVFDFPLE